MATEHASPIPDAGLYTTPVPLLTSMLRDGFMHKKWSWWKAKYFQFLGEGKLFYSKVRGVQKACYLFDITECKIERIKIKIETASILGIVVTCKKDNLETSFRCIVPTQEALENFCQGIRQSSAKNNVPAFLDELRANNPYLNTGDDAIVPRKGIIELLNQAENRNIYLTTKHNRGAFRWMPVYFRNDLVHGSWWFVFGSLFITLSSAVVVFNKVYLFLGDDDSELSPAKYEDSWILLIASGVFFTIGSLAFVRAMSEPPMKPMFSWYHFGTDELFGSWMFTLATFPAIPWSLIYLFEFDSLMYIGLLVLSVIAVIGCLLFVYACYPYDGKDHHKRSAMVLPYLLACCVCGGAAKVFDRDVDVESANDPHNLLSSHKNNMGWWEQTIRLHCSSDWLIGTWIVLWATAVAVFCFAGYTLYCYSWGSSEITNFVNITTTLDTAIFLIGSIYFVCGSYETKKSEGIVDFSTDIQGDQEVESPASDPEVALEMRSVKTGAAASTESARESNRPAPALQTRRGSMSLRDMLANVQPDVDDPDD